VDNPLRYSRRNRIFCPRAGIELFSRLTPFLSKANGFVKSRMVASAFMRQWLL